MKNLKQMILSPGCLRCGSFFSESSLFCEVCYMKEVGFYKSTAFSSNEHVFLFRWDRSANENQIMDQLVYRLKSDNAVQAQKIYAQHLAVKISSLLNVKKYAAFVPVPSANIRSTHAHSLAKFLSGSLDLPVLDFLNKAKTVKAQKYMTAFERKQVNSFSLKPEYSEEFTGLVRPEASYIFVDDVLTTGQSFKHCSNAVYWSKRNVIATLFYRPPLN